MDADHGLFDVRHAALQHPDDVAHVGRRRITDGVGDVHRGGPGFDRRLDHLAEEVDLGARGVLGRELDVRAIPFGPLDALHGGGDDVLLGHFELVLAVDGAGGEEDVNPRLFGILDGLPGAVDVFVTAAGQAADHRASYVLGDPTDRLEVAGRSDGETRFDHVHPEFNQGFGNLHLFLEVHARSGRLLAIAERGVENDDGTGSRINHGIRYLRFGRKASDLGNRLRPPTPGRHGKRQPCPRGAATAMLPATRYARQSIAHGETRHAAEGDNPHGHLPKKETPRRAALGFLFAFKSTADARTLRHAPRKEEQSKP